MKRSFTEAFDDLYDDESNKRTRTDPFVKKLSFKDIIMGPSPRVGVGIVWLRMDEQHLLPTIQSALALAGFSDIAEGQLWLKTMSDGTQRAIKIFFFSDDRTAFVENTIAFGNAIVIMQDTTETLDQPAVIHSVSDIGTMFFNTPLDYSGMATNIDVVYTIESRPLNQFNETQRNLLDHMRKNYWTQSQYLIMTSSHHQHQLGMLIDTITADFYAGIDRRLSRLVFTNESPCDLDVLGPLTRLGLTGDVLLKWHQDNYVHYLVYQDVVPTLLIWCHKDSYAAELPSFVRMDAVRPLELEQIYNHPDSSHIKTDIREVLNLLRLNRATRVYEFHFN